TMARACGPASREPLPVLRYERRPRTKLHVLLGSITHRRSLGRLVGRLGAPLEAAPFVALPRWPMRSRWKAELRNSNHGRAVAPTTAVGRHEAGFLAYFVRLAHPARQVTASPSGAGGSVRSLAPSRTGSITKGVEQQAPPKPVTSLHVSQARLTGKI